MSSGPDYNAREELTVVTDEQPGQDHMNAGKAGVDPDSKLQTFRITIRTELTYLLHSGRT